VNLKLRSKLFYGYVASLFIYSCFALLPKPDVLVLAQYNVSVLGLRIIYATIILLLAAIWFAGFYGYSKLNSYARIIKKEKDGKQVAKLSGGLFLLALWLPISSVVSVILNYFARKYPGILPAVVIFNNFINLLLPLGGFLYISKGARGLSELVRRRPTYAASQILIIAVIYLGLIYLHLVDTTTSLTEIYHMPNWLVLLTLVAPYVYMWFIGLLAAYEIYLYRRKVAGIVYKKSWGYLAFGLAWLIVTSVSFQYITTLTPHFSKLSIYWLLAIIYSMLAVLSVGFILIAIGARKLQRIEEA
jgi:hypothetical protein